MFALQRNLEGRNEVVEVGESFMHFPGNLGFCDFLRKNGLCSWDYVEELAHVLKVPLEKLAPLYQNKGYIEKLAQLNILEHKACRKITEALKEFEERQLPAEPKPPA